MTFTCTTCNEEHELSELSFGAHEPVQWQLISDAERAHSELFSDQCIIESKEGTSYYIRACLQIPIRGTDQHFVWGVWASLSDKSFKEISKHWYDPKRVKMGPYFGWLCTRIPEYPDTVYLKTMVHQRPVGERPLIELEPTDHPLSVHQREGIEPSELQRIITKLLH